jgi:hypothetical protein
LSRKLTEAGHTEGEDGINYLVKHGCSRVMGRSVLSSSLGCPTEVVLLGFIEDTIDALHASSGYGSLGVDDVEARTNHTKKVVQLVATG